MAEGNVRIYVGADGTGYQPSPIAQSVERSAVNRKVGGSSPPGRAPFLILHEHSKTIRTPYSS